jgi:hypothetical protein
MLYTAKFTPGPTDLIVAGGSGKKPCVKVFQTVRSHSILPWHIDRLSHRHAQARTSDKHRHIHISIFFRIWENLDFISPPNWAI